MPRKHQKQCQVFASRKALEKQSCHWLLLPTNWVLCQDCTEVQYIVRGTNIQTRMGGKWCMNRSKGDYTTQRIQPLRKHSLRRETFCTECQPLQRNQFYRKLDRLLCCSCLASPNDVWKCERRKAIHCGLFNKVVKAVEVRMLCLVSNLEVVAYENGCDLHTIVKVKGSLIQACETFFRPPSRKTLGKVDESRSNLHRPPTEWQGP